MLDQSPLSLASQTSAESDIVIQEKIDGPEYGLDVVNDLDGNHVATFVKKKIAMWAGETDGATTDNNPCLAEDR